MAMDDKWARKREFEKTGTWPATSGQEKKAVAENRKADEITAKYKNRNLSWIQDLDKKQPPQKPEAPTLF